MKKRILPFLNFQIHQPPVGRRPGPHQLHVCRGVAELHQDGAVSGELPRRRHQHHGRRRQPDGEGAHGVGHHPRRTPEEDHEQRAEHQGADTRQRLGGLPGLKGRGRASEVRLDFPLGKRIVSKWAEALGFRGEPVTVF